MIKLIFFTLILGLSLPLLASSQDSHFINAFGTAGDCKTACQLAEESIQSQARVYCQADDFTIEEFFVGECFSPGGYIIECPVSASMHCSKLSLNNMTNP